jgi:hypothetical protein
MISSRSSLGNLAKNGKPALCVQLLYPLVEVGDGTTNAFPTVPAGFAVVHTGRLAADGSLYGDYELVNGHASRVERVKTHRLVHSKIVLGEDRDKW